MKSCLEDEVVNHMLMLCLKCSIVKLIEESAGSKEVVSTFDILIQIVMGSGYYLETEQVTNLESTGIIIE